MNCKPGDMAIVTRGAHTPIEKKILGHIVHVMNVDERNVWTIEEPFWLHHSGRTYRITGICDESLTPIRGLDAPEEISDEVMA